MKIFSFLTVALVGCSSTSEKSVLSKKPETVARKVVENHSIPEPRYFSILAPSVNDEPSEPVFVPKGWTCTWRTVPSGESLLVWIDGQNPPALSLFGKKAQSIGAASFLQFGSMTNGCTYVKIVLYPPGFQPNLSVVSE